MDTPLLSTKLFIPSMRPGLVPRPRLMERLNSALTTPFTLVSAPAGFGKTTVITHWIGATKPPLDVAWVSLDEGDNDPVRFWDYCMAALRTILPNCGDNALTLEHELQPVPIESFLTLLINDLTVISEDFVLVLDDYHLIHSPAVHRGTVFLVDHLPPKMHLVIVSRADPPLPLARFRGKGMLTDIGADALRFSYEETAGLFAQMGVAPLSNEDVKMLTARAEGWVAGLKMAALSMQGRKDIGAFLASFTGSQRYVMDYLIEEVLRSQTDEVRDFLLQTSVLERMTEPLCDFLTGDRPDHDMLAELDRANLFLVPLDDARRWYRYHHLFAELLRHQLESTSGGPKVKELHQRASQWYEQRGFVDDAVHHALAAQDWETAVKLVDHVAQDRIKQGERRTLIRWLESIPEIVLRGHHRLYSQYATVLAVFGEYDAAEAALDYLERVAHDDPDLQGEVAVSQTTLAQRRGDYARALALAEKALTLLKPGNLAMRARASFTAGYVQYEMGLFDTSSARLSEAYELAMRAGDQWIASSALNFLAAITHQRGRLHEALEMANRAVGLSGQSPGAAVAWCRVTIIQYELNELEAAAVSARRAAELSEMNASARVVAYLYEAMTRLSRGDTGGATESMAKLDEAGRDPTNYPSFRARHVAGRVIFAIRQDDLETALRWGRRLPEYSAVLPLEFAHTATRLLIAQDKRPEAAAQLLSVYERIAKAGAHGLAVGIRVCQSLAAANEEEGVSFLSEALVRGEAEGYIRTFVDEGKLLKPLLRQAILRGIEPSYSRKLLDIIEAEARQRKIRRGEMPATPSNAGLLSQRELEVLRLVIDGLSNQQIADRLTISLSTAKTHVYHVFDKLDAKDRLQAVTRAKELKLI